MLKNVYIHDTMADILDDWKRKFNRNLDDNDIWGLWYNDETIDTTKTLSETGYLWNAHLSGPKGCFRIIGKWNKIKHYSMGGVKWHYDGDEEASDDDTDDGDGDNNESTYGFKIIYHKRDGGECSGSGDGGGDKKRAATKTPPGDNEPGGLHNLSRLHVKNKKVRTSIKDLGDRIVYQGWVGTSHDADC